MLKCGPMIVMIGVLLVNLIGCSHVVLEQAATSSITIDPKAPFDLSKVIVVTESLRVNIVAPEAQRVEIGRAHV